MNAAVHPSRQQRRQPTFAELFTPKLVTVLREGYGLARLARRRDRRADRRDRRAAAVDGDRHRLRRRARARASTRPSSAASSSRRSAAAASRSAARPAPSSCWSPRPSARHGVDGLILATMMSGRHPARRRLPAARHLHQVHPLSGDGRLHRRHRRHHLRQPDQGTARPDARRHGARARCSPKLAALWRGAADASTPRRSRVAALTIGIIVGAASACGRTGRAC